MSDKKKSIYAAILLLFLIFFIAACSPTSSSQSVEITQQGFYVTDKYPEADPGKTEYAVSVYCEYKNNTKKDIFLKNLRVYAYDKNDKLISDDRMAYAPTLLRPSETGYASSPDLTEIKLNSIDDLDRIEIEPIYADATNTTNILECSDPQLIKDDSLGGDAHGNKVQVTVENKGETTADSYHVTCGFFDDNGKLIGAGQIDWGNSVELQTGQKANLLIDKIALESGNLSDVKHYEPRAGYTLLALDEEIFNDQAVKNLEIDAKKLEVNPDNPLSESDISDKDEIVGKWEMTKAGTGAEDLKLAYQFEVDGTVKMYAVQNGNLEVYDLTYKKAPKGYNIYYTDKDVPYMGFYFEDGVLNSFFAGGEGPDSSTSEYKQVESISFVE